MFKKTVYVLIFLLIFLFSCNSINNMRINYLQGKYENQYNLCITIMNNKENLDSLINSDTLIHPELKSYYENNYYKWLNEFLICEKYVLIEIKKYSLSISRNTEKKVLKFIFTLYKNNIKIEVIRFTFHKEKNDIFKLIHITENPNNYYQYRRPKVNQPNLPFY